MKFYILGYPLCQILKNLSTIAIVNIWETAQQNRTLYHSWKPLEGHWGWLPGFAEVWEVHFCQQVPLDAPVVAVLKEDALLSAVRLVARSTLAPNLDVELDKVHPRRVKIPAHQQPLASLSKRQKNHRFNHLGALWHSVISVSRSYKHPSIRWSGFCSHYTVERSKLCHLILCSGYGNCSWIHLISLTSLIPRLRYEALGNC